MSDISIAIRRLKDHSLHKLVLDEVMGMELSNFSRQLKMRPGIDDNHQVKVDMDMSNDLWLRVMEVEEEDNERQNAKETKAHLKAMVLRTTSKPLE